MRARLPILALVLASPLAFAAPGDGTPECNCPGEPGYVLTVPRTVALGDSFLTCAEVPACSLVFILISAGPGPLETKVGPLCLDYPFITIWPVVVPCGTVCLEHFVECDPAIDHFTGWFQFVALDPFTNELHVSNGSSLIAIDDGSCIPAP